MELNYTVYEALSSNGGGNYNISGLLMVLRISSIKIGGEAFNFQAPLFFRVHVKLNELLSTFIFFLPIFAFYVSC